MFLDRFFVSVWHLEIPARDIPEPWIRYCTRSAASWRPRELTGVNVEGSWLPPTLSLLNRAETPPVSASPLPSRALTHQMSSSPHTPPFTLPISELASYSTHPHPLSSRDDASLDEIANSNGEQARLAQGRPPTRPRSTTVSAAMMVCLTTLFPSKFS